MQIQLKQADIEQAIKSYVASIGVTRSVESIDFTMGRKDSGLTAAIEVSDRVTHQAEAIPAGPVNRGIPTPAEKVAVSAAATDDSVEAVGVVKASAETEAKVEEALADGVVETGAEEASAANEESALQEKTSLFGS